jgi:hypothetical protein
MAYTQGQQNYGIAAAISDIPPSFSSSGLPRPIASTVQINSIASTSAAQGAGGLVTFSIPTGPSSGYIKNNSMYLRATITNTNAAPGADVRFALPSGSASSIINRLTVSVGSQQVCQINNYHYLAEMLLSHTTSRNFYVDDSAILQFTGLVPFPNAGPVASVEVVIPIICPLFNSDKAFPAYLLNAPILVQFDLNSVNNAFRGANADIPNFTVSNAQLVYEAVLPDNEFVSMVKGGMAQGNLYQLNLRDFMTLTTASSGSLNYQIGCNLSSVNALLYTQVKNAPVNTADTLLLDNTQTNCRLYLDGRQINNFNLSSRSQIFAEMNRALGNMFDSNITTACTAATYLTTQFTGGISCRRVSDEMAMTGTPAQNVNLQLDSAGGANNTYIVILYEQVLTIDGNGNVMLIK